MFRWLGRVTLLALVPALGPAALVAEEKKCEKPKKPCVCSEYALPSLTRPPTLEGSEVFLAEVRELQRQRTDPHDAACVWTCAVGQVNGEIQALILPVPRPSPEPAPQPRDTAPNAAPDKDPRKDLATLQDLRARILVAKSDVDPQNLHLDFFAAPSFSNLFRDPKTQGYFDESRPFFVLEIRQQLSHHKKSAIGTYGTVSFQKSKGESPTQSTSSGQGRGGTDDPPPDADVIASVAGFSFQGGIAAWRPLFSAHVDGVLFAGGGATSISYESADDAGLKDQFKHTYQAGLRLKQRGGAWRGTYAEFSYLHDPRFDHPDRFLTVGRIVLGPDLDGSQKPGLGAYVEGAVNVGRGKDEVRITVGVRLDPLSVLRGIVGTVGAGSPAGGVANGEHEN